MNRKLFSLFCLALAALTASLNIFATPVRSNVAADNLALLESEEDGWEKSTAKYYVQDGLIAMWDGIENTGWGRHDSNTSVWVDLVGGVEMRLGIPAQYQARASFQWDNGSLHYTDSYGETFNPVFYWSEVSLSQSLVEFFNGGFGTLEILYFSNSNNRTYTILGWTNPTVSYYWYETPFFPSYVPVPGIPNEFNLCSITKSRQYYNGQLYKSSALTLKSNAYSLGQIFKAFCRRGNYNSGNVMQFCIRFYNRALTAEEIAHNYSLDKERFNLP